MIDLVRNGEVFILTMTDGENRWNTSFVRAFAKALDEVERSQGPAALVTASSSDKFFSNGLDLDWIGTTAAHPGGDRSDRGFVCANEMQLGMRIPPPELALFRHRTCSARGQPFRLRGSEGESVR